MPAARFGHNSGTHTWRNLRRPVCRVVVDDDDLGDERGGKITQDTADGLRLVAGRNDDLDSHSTSVWLPPESAWSPARQKGINTPRPARAPSRPRQRGQH